MANLFDSLKVIADVRRLIDEAARESNVLEYKTASAALSEKEKNEIGKDVSAMANALGGTIIYGVATDQTDKTLPARIEPIHLKNIETIDRVITSGVRPLLSGIRLKPIPANKPQVLIIDVPESDNPPHQALFDKKYYRRTGIQSVPMEHDLVALYFGRKNSPQLGLQIEPIVNQERKFRLSIRNESRRMARYVFLRLSFPPKEYVQLTDDRSLTNIDKLQPDGQARQFSNNDSVFHGGTNIAIIELEITITPLFPPSYEQPLISWILMADEMQPQNGQFTLKELGLTVPEANADAE